jgi:hypothetical protein
LILEITTNDERIRIMSNINKSAPIKSGTIRNYDGVMAEVYIPEKVPATVKQRKINTIYDILTNAEKTS